MKNLADKITKKIKKDEIKPKSKWFFLLKNYFIWSVFTLAVISGGVAFVVIIFGITSNDWDIHEHLHQSFGQYFLLTLPYYWIGLMTIFLAIAAVYYRHTSTGYRYKVYLILLGSIVVSFLLGIILFTFGAGEKLEDMFANRLPYYHNFMDQRIETWSHPEEGLLAGRIIKVVDSENIKVKDLSRQEWMVDIKNAHIANSGRAKIIKENKVIKIIGEEEGENKFKAEKIRPWEGRHERCGQHLRRMNMEREHRQHKEDDDN